MRGVRAGWCVLMFASAVLAAAVAQAAPRPLRVLVVAGGHPYAVEPFRQVFAGFADMQCTFVDEKKTGEAFDDISGWNYDAIVLYNYMRKPTPKQQENFLALLDRGVGLVILHHAIYGYRPWPEFQKIVGVTSWLSGAKDGFDLKIHVEDPNHPITQGVRDFTIHDEVYIGAGLDPQVHVLLSTDNPANEKAIAWVHKYRQSPVCYFQLGHDAKAYGQPEFSRVLAQAIRWAADKTSAAKLPARAAAAAPAPSAPAPSADDKDLTARSLVSEGDTARLARVLAKARAGGAVNVAVIGGSITQGAAATKPEFRYGNRIAQWWQKQFPQAKVEFVNAGIGATGSNFGALRAQRDLLSKKPDFVVVEYAVNDGNVQASAESLEGLLRQILEQPQQPAVVLLFTMNQSGGNAQEWHGKVGSHYHLPMVSFRDALWPAIQAGKLKWEEVEADQVHPNDRGHGYCAAFVTALVEQIDKKVSAKELPPVGPLPAPLFGDLFARCALYEAADLKPVANQGWTLDAKTASWKSDQPGSVIEFDLPGRALFSMHYVVKGPMGKVRVTIDGARPRELNGWFDKTWGGYRQTNEIARLDTAATHRVRFELLSDKSADSSGHEFRILGLGAAGIAK